MKRFFTYTLLALLVLGALPATVAAQVYPERLAIKVKARTAIEAANAYQRRSRDDNNREEQTERTTKVIKLGSSGALDLGNIAGDITVLRGNGADATIEIVKTARGRDAADAKELLQLVQVEVTERNGRAEVKTHYPTGDEAMNKFVADKIDAAAGVKQPLVLHAKANPNLRVMDGRFQVIEQAMGTPKGRDASVRYLREFIEEMKASGFVAKALEKSGQTDAAVAPPSPAK